MRRKSRWGASFFWPGIEKGVTTLRGYGGRVGGPTRKSRWGATFFWRRSERVTRLRGARRGADALSNLEHPETSQPRDLATLLQQDISTRFRPRCLATYSARSARSTRALAVRTLSALSASTPAMPMEAVTLMLAPSIGTADDSTRVRIRSATA